MNSRMHSPTSSLTVPPPRRRHIGQRRHTIAPPLATAGMKARQAPRDGCPASLPTAITRCARPRRTCSNAAICQAGVRASEPLSPTSLPRLAPSLSTTGWWENLLLRRWMQNSSAAPNPAALGGAHFGDDQGVISCGSAAGEARRSSGLRLSPTRLCFSPGLRDTGRQRCVQTPLCRGARLRVTSPVVQVYLAAFSNPGGKLVRFTGGVGAFTLHLCSDPFRR